MEILTISDLKRILNIADINQLTIINLNNRTITRIHEDIFNGLTNLIEIDLSYNQILEINFLNDLSKLNSIDLSDNKIKELNKDAFNGLTNLEKLVINKNQISKIHENAFNGLTNLTYISLIGNEIEVLPKDTFNGLTNLTSINLCVNKIKKIENDSFLGLSKLSVIFLSANQIEKIDKYTFNGLTDVVEIYLCKNPINEIHKDAFRNLSKLKGLYFHPISYVASDFLIGLKLEKLTLFDEFVYKDIHLNDLQNNIEINPTNVSNIFGKPYYSDFFSYTITRNYLKDVKLNSSYFCLNESFEWIDIPNKFSLLIGVNGIGKTVLLKLIEEGLNESNSKDDSFIARYFNCKSLILNTLEINKTIKIDSNSVTRKSISEKLLNQIDDFCIVQYFDYLLLCDYSIDDFKFNQKIFKYKISVTMFNFRKRQQTIFIEKMKRYKRNEFVMNEYYREIKEKSIENFLELSEQTLLDENHTLSLGENLIMLLELWKIHARKQQEENEKEKRPINNKLRILLLDEIDAHMHPKLIKDFIDLIKSDDLNYLNLQVIITSHNPITVSFTPIENISQMINQNNQVLIKKVKSRKEAMVALTNHLVTIDIPTRLVFVEANDDKLFYEFLKEYLHKIKFPSISFDENLLKFLTVSLNRNDGNSCKSTILKMVKLCVNNFETIDDSKVDHIFGIVDKDNDENKPQTNIHVLNRYTLENYLFDPIIIYCYILSKNSDHEMEKRINDEFKVKVTISSIFSLDSERLKSLYEIVLINFRQEIEKTLSEEKYSGDTIVEFCTKITSIEKETIKVHYPNVFLKHIGHRNQKQNQDGIKEKMSRIINNNRATNNNDIIEFLEKQYSVEKDIFRIIPLDLIEILKKIQEPDYNDTLNSQKNENKPSSFSYTKEKEKINNSFDFLIEFYKDDSLKQTIENLKQSLQNEENNNLHKKYKRDIFKLLKNNKQKKSSEILSLLKDLFQKNETNRDLIQIESINSPEDALSLLGDWYFYLKKSKFNYNIVDVDTFKKILIDLENFFQNKKINNKDSKSICENILNKYNKKNDESTADEFVRQLKNELNFDLEIIKSTSTYNALFNLINMYYYLKADKSLNNHSYKDLELPNNLKLINKKNFVKHDLENIYQDFVNILSKNIFSLFENEVSKRFRYFTNGENGDLVKIMIEFTYENNIQESEDITFSLEYPLILIECSKCDLIQIYKKLFKVENLNDFPKYDCDFFETYSLILPKFYFINNQKDLIRLSQYQLLPQKDLISKEIPSTNSNMTNNETKIVLSNYFFDPFIRYLFEHASDLDRILGLERNEIQEMIIQQAKCVSQNIESNEELSNDEKKLLKSTDRIKFKVSENQEIEVDYPAIFYSSKGKRLEIIFKDVPLKDIKEFVSKNHKKLLKPHEVNSTYQNKFLNDLKNFVTKKNTKEEKKLKKNKKFPISFI